MMINGISHNIIPYYLKYSNLLNKQLKFEYNHKYCQMKLKAKPSRTTTPIEHKKSFTKIHPSNKNIIVNKAAIEPKKKSHRDRILSAINNKQKKSKHNLSQSQLHNQNNCNSVYIDDKEIGGSTQYTKSRTKNNASSVRKSKDDIEIKENLLQTFKILQHRLKLKQQKIDHTTLGLSRSIYQIIKNTCININQTAKPNSQSNGPTMPSFNNSGADFARDDQTEKVNKQNYHINQKVSLDKNQKKGHNSSSSLLEYFEDKFGSSAQDEEALQKKLRMIQALKRSQDMASRCSSHYSSSLNSQHQQAPGKQTVRQKIKQKSGK